MYLNETVIEGIIPKKPQLKITKTGKKLTQFYINNITYFVKANGDEVEEGMWLLCEAYGDTAEDFVRDIPENDTIQLYGKLRTDKLNRLILSVNGYKRIRRL